MNERMKRREEGEVEAEMRHVWLRGEGGRIYLYRERVVDWRQTNKPNQTSLLQTLRFVSARLKQIDVFRAVQDLHIPPKRD